VLVPAEDFFGHFSVKEKDEASLMLCLHQGSKEPSFPVLPESGGFLLSDFCLVSQSFNHSREIFSRK
jgi:hypothetical protein